MSVSTQNASEDEALAWAMRESMQASAPPPQTEDEQLAWAMR